MPVFKLTPVRGRKDDGRWLASTHSEVCWLNARDADAARVVMQAATTRFVERQSTTVDSPWLDDALVKCEQDDSKSVPDGHYITAKDRVLPL